MFDLEISIWITVIIGDEEVESSGDYPGFVTSMYPTPDYNDYRGDFKKPDKPKF